MRLTEFLLWAGLVVLDVWMWNLTGPNRWKGYGSAFLLSLGLYLSDWGVERPNRTLALLVAVVTVAAIHEVVVRSPLRMFGRYRVMRRRLGSDDDLFRPTWNQWDKLGTQFRKYDGDFDAHWEFFSQSSHLDWSIPRSRRNARLIQEFHADAQRAGLLVRAMGPRPLRFPLPSNASHEDYWLTVLLTDVDSGSDITAAGSSRTNGDSIGGEIVNVVHASSIACKQLAMESVAQSQAADANAGSVRSTIS